MKKIIVLSTLCLGVFFLRAQWTTSGNDVYNSNSGNVGIGITSPAYKVDINGSLRALSFYLGANGVTSQINASGSGHLWLNTGNVNIGDSTGYIGNGANLSLFNTNSGSLYVGLSLNYYSRFWHSPQTGNGYYTWSILGNSYNLFELGQGTVKMPVLGTGSGNGVRPLTIAEDGSVASSPYLKVDGTTLIVGGANAYGTIFLNNNTQYISTLMGTNTGVLFVRGYKKTTLENNDPGGYRHFVTFDEEGRALFGSSNSATSQGDYKLQVTGGLLLAGQSAAPSGVNGGVIYNSSSNQFQGYRNGVWKNFLMEGDGTSGSGETNFWTLSGTNIYNNTSGNIGIGTSNPQAKLSVNGTVLSSKVKVTQSGWSDYVFENGYELLTLAEVEKYIRQHKHLPDVPSTKDVQTDGLDLGDNQATLLKKIEELTLYIIDVNKKVQKLSNENVELKEKLETITNRLGSSPQQ